MVHRPCLRFVAAAFAVIVVPALGAACSNKDEAKAPPPPSKAPVNKPVAIDAGAAKLEPPAPLPELAADPGSGDGKPLWTLPLGGLGSDVVRDLASNAAGDALVVGDFEGEATFAALGVKTSTASADKPKSDAFLMKIGGDGKPAWVQTMGGENEDTGNAVAVGKGLIAIGGLFGETMSVGGMTANGAGSDDAFVAAFADDGSPRWLWSAGGDASDVVLGLAATADGGFVAAGGFFGKASFGAIEVEAISYEDAFLVKLSAEGEVEWAKNFGGDRDDRFVRLAVDAQGSIYALGTFEGKAAFGGPPLESAGSHDLVLVKLDARGEHLWSQRFGGLDNEVGAGLAVDPAGNVTVVGSFDQAIKIGDEEYRGAGTSDVLVVRLGADGTLAWSRRFGGRGEDIASGAAADGAGNVIVSGWFEGEVDFGAGKLKAATGGNKDVFVVKLDATGATRWARRFGDRDHDKARAAAVTPDGDVYVGGIFRFVLEAPGKIESVHDADDKAPKSDGYVIRIQR